MFFHLRTPYTDTTFGVRAELRSPQVVPSYRHYWSIFCSFWFCIFGSGMWPSSLRVKFRLFTFWNIADTPRTRGSECKQRYGYDTQKTMFAAVTIVPCRLKWEGWLFVLCVYIIPFGESSFRDYLPIGQIFFPRPADRTIFPVFFFVLCSFQPNCWTLGVFFIKIEKRQLWVRPIELLKLNFASCVLHQTRSLDVFIL